jgi:hypothetical protein
MYLGGFGSRGWAGTENIHNRFYVKSGHVCKKGLVLGLYLTKRSLFHVCEHFSFFLTAFSS